ncbi:hypothetical protein VP1G_08014 [Cytospora mali]|uniref:Uncharacterized protein n=1 Tax=Cytospora mali TaxID=578113 RepID=A0A194VA32_CYTMA|nr:hypothetical protein VP1G_08014 [Valsa mali var. pyri (nom. inval.)]
MGGVTWTVEEEILFWRKIVRLAPPGLDESSKKGKKKFQKEKSWAPLAKLMQTLMREQVPGQAKRRTYTTIGCYEHYYQNYHHGKYSPNAEPYVKEYREWLTKNQSANDGNSAAASNIPPKAFPTLKPTSRAARRQRITQARQTQAHTAPYAVTETQLAPMAPMFPFTPSMTTPDKTAGTATQGLSPGNALQGTRYNQATPTFKAPFYSSVGTKSPSGATMGFTQPMTARSTTQGYSNNASYGGAMSTSRNYNSLNDLSNQSPGYLYQTGSRGYSGQANGMYSYINGGQSHTNKGHSLKGSGTTPLRSGHRFNKRSTAALRSGQNFDNVSTALRAGQAFKGSGNVLRPKQSFTNCGTASSPGRYNTNGLSPYVMHDGGNTGLGFNHKLARPDKHDRFFGSL